MLVLSKQINHDKKEIALAKPELFEKIAPNGQNLPEQRSIKKSLHFSAVIAHQNL
jgi:hypothetical protein